MSEVSRSLSYARVDYNPAYAATVFGALALTPEHSPEAGWSQSDSTQAATNLSILRDAVACPNRLEVAIFNQDGSAYDVAEFFGISTAQKGLTAIAKAGRFAVPVAGEAPLCDETGKSIALAIDELLVRIGKTSEGGEIPASVSPIVLPAVALVAIIVSGAALAVVGVAAVWRYLDPDLRRDIGIVKVAADSYASRLQAFQQTGTMPPASDVETAAMPTVQGLAKERGKTDWITGAAIAGGFALGIVVVGAVSGYRARRSAA